MRFFTIVLFTVISSAGFAQNVKAISKLKEKLARANEQEQFGVLTDLVWEYRAYHPDSGIYYGQKALALAEQQQRKDVAKCFNFLGLAYLYKGDALEGYDYFFKALHAAETEHDELHLAHANNNLGRLFVEQNMLARSLEFLNKAQALFKKLNDAAGLAYSYQSLANYYKLSSNLPEAEANLMMALNIRAKAGQTSEHVSILIQIGRFYKDTGQLDKALSYLHQADSVDQAVNNELYRAQIKVYLADCYLKKNEFGNAERLAAEGISKIESAENKRMLPEAYLIMGQIQFGKNQFDKARNYFRQSLQVSSDQKNLNFKMEAYFQLWQTYKMQKDEVAEFESYRQYVILKDSVRSLEMAQHESELKFKSEIEKRDKENEILRLREQRKSVLLTVSIIITLLALMILYTQIKYRRKILRINHLLEDRNNEIKKINSVLENKNVTLEKHMHTLVDLSRNRSIAVGNLARATKDIVKLTAQKLNVSRVSIWIYDEVRQCIETIAFYHLDADSFSDKATLHFKDAPHYFEVIKKERMIVADDARSHASTREFNDFYLVPADIYSMLDVTFFHDGKLRGLLCCEQQHAMRTWTAEDKIFVSSMADIISLAFRTSQRLEYELQIKDQNRKISHLNEELEERVKQRTHELEIQNKKLIEYAFINSHQLRGPLSRILGLINLIEHEEALKGNNILSLLRRSGDDLDKVVRQINETLHKEGHNESLN